MKGINDGGVRVNSVISLHLYTKWSKIVKTGGKLESYIVGESAVS